MLNLIRIDHPFMVPFLINRADGVNGHYCIARNNPDGYHEYWDDKQQKWCSSGTVFNLEDNNNV